MVSGASVQVARVFGTHKSLALDSAGNVLVAATGRLRVIAAATGTFYGIAMTAGHIYTVAGTGKTGFAGDGGPAAKAELEGIDAITTDPAGDVLIGDRLRIRSISP